jgi:hypothetical protein
MSSLNFDKSALSILMMEGSSDIPIVYSDRKLIFYIQVLFILTELTDKSLYTGS